MKKLLLFWVCLMTSFLSANATYWICSVKTDLHMKEEPTKVDNNSICVIPAGEFIVIDDEDRKNGNVYALWVRGDTYGYVTEDYIEKVQVLATNEVNVLQETGKIKQDDPELVIKNKCNGKVTVLLNGLKHSIAAGETKTVVVPAGKVSIFVSSPGMIPFSTTQYVKSNRSYRWEFYIERETKNRKGS